MPPEYLRPELWPLLLTILLILRAVDGEWVFDDPAIPDIEEIHGKMSNGDYRLNRHNLMGPRSLTHWGYYLTWRHWGFNRRAWHVWNLINHCINVVLLYPIVELLPSLTPFQRWAAVMLFAVHPIVTVGAAYISNRAAIQSTTFGFTGLLAVGAGLWPLALLSAFLGQRSKEDSWIFVCFWPIFSDSSVITSVTIVGLYLVSGMLWTRISQWFKYFPRL